MASVADLMPKEYPAWLQRAMDPSTPMTEGNETVRTASSYSEELGGEVLFPMIRMNEQGQLKRFNDWQEAYRAAMDAKDYILIPGPADESTGKKATALSKYISDVLIAGSRADDSGTLMMKGR